MPVRRWWPLVVLILCACHKRSGGTGDAAASPDDRSGSALFARPIAALKTRSGAVMVAGIVPSRGSVAVVRLGADGAASAAVDAWAGVTPGANAELRIFEAPGGAVVVYRGYRDGQPVTEAATVTEEGKVVAPPMSAGAAACATEDALAWIGRTKGGGSSVRYARGGLAVASELASISSERDPTLVCGSRSIFALGDGERDTTLSMLPSDAEAPSVVMRERDFKDEEREHDTFVVKDTLGIVRVGQSGSVAVRRVGPGETEPWRRFAARLGEGDDVAAVDGDDDSSLVVYTRDESKSCDGPAAPSVHVLTLVSSTSVERLLDVEGPECDRDLGPFFTGAVSGSFVIAWVERASAVPAGGPKVTGLAYRTVLGSGVGEMHRVPKAVEEMVDAGCDKDRCYAVTLSGGKLDSFAYP
jgi:hypothetical protein